MPATHQPRRDALLKALRGTDFRRALKAIGELRADDGPVLTDLIDRYRAPDEQREVQLRIARIVFARGVGGLVSEWPSLADARWRAELVREIGQFLALWRDEAVIDLLLAALEDPHRDVQVAAVWTLWGIVRDIPERERRTARAESHRSALAALDTLRGWMTPARRSRATQRLVAMLEQHTHAPYPVLPRLVEILGATATRNDGNAVQALEALLSQSGEPVHVSYEALDPARLAPAERLVAERKGLAPERLKARITYRGTGLLDQRLLTTALRRIRDRA